MPSTGFYPFLPCILPEMESRFSVSMPSTGFYPFLLYVIYYNRFGDICVNALNGLLSISTGRKPGGISKNFRCQCPQRASIHFYDESRRWLYNEGCVNALNGLLSISTIESTGYFKTAWGVSMPSTGFYPFLPILKQENGKTFIVSMPSTGFYPFLQIREVIQMTNETKCQCPQRASIHFYSSLSEALILLASES